MKKTSSFNVKFSCYSKLNQYELYTIELQQQSDIVGISEYFFPIIAQCPLKSLPAKKCYVFYSLILILKGKIYLRKMTVSC